MGNRYIYIDPVFKSIYNKNVYRRRGRGAPERGDICIDPVFKSIYILTQKQGQYIYIRNSDVSIDIYIDSVFKSIYNKNVYRRRGRGAPELGDICIDPVFKSIYIYIDTKTGSIYIYS